MKIITKFFKSFENRTGQLTSSAMLLSLFFSTSLFAEEVKWLAEVQQPPKIIPRENLGYIEPLLQTTTGKKITTLAAWKEQRDVIRKQWLKFLGPMPAKRPNAKFKVISEEKLPKCIRQLVEYEGEPGQKVRGYLLIPKDLDQTKRHPAIVALHATTTLTIKQISGIKGNERRKQGLQLCQRGFVVFCPENFLWQNVSGYTDAVKKFQQRHPNTKGMHKMLYDAMRGVDVLEALPYVDKQRIGAFGHSLGAKEVLYLAAFDERIQVAIASEGGLGFKSTNWNAPWYLGKSIHKKDFKLNHHQLLALTAPRAMLVLGGEKGRGSADGDRSWAFIEAALPVYALYKKTARLGLYNHHEGHDVSPKVYKRVEEWFVVYLKLGK